ncbi:MAG: RHS repeat-associated core domain-containing protein [Brumimicrobium sp.]
MENSLGYYAFGMVQPGRSFNLSESRHLFNGMEADAEVSGDGNSYTTEFRQYDPRLGRWKSLDPLMSKYPNMYPYVAFNNNPIYFTDPLGLEGDPPKGGGDNTRGWSDEGGGSDQGNRFYNPDGGSVVIRGDKAPRKRRFFRLDNGRLHEAQEGDVFIDKLNNVYEFTINDNKKVEWNFIERRQNFDEVEIRSNSGIKENDNHYNPETKKVDENKKTWTFFQGVEAKGTIWLRGTITPDNFAFKHLEGSDEKYSPSVGVSLEGYTHAQDYETVDWYAEIIVLNDGEVFSKSILSTIADRPDGLINDDYTYIGKTRLSLPTSGKITLKIKSYYGIVRTGGGAGAVSETIVIEREIETLNED